MARPERLELPTLWFEARCSDPTELRARGADIIASLGKRDWPKNGPEQSDSGSSRLAFLAHIPKYQRLIGHLRWRGSETLLQNGHGPHFMTTPAFHLEELKNAYRVLDVPLSASEHTIKQSQRRLLKRWHPDLFPAGSPQCAEATEMTRLVNGAYAKIATAPLRHYRPTGGDVGVPHIHVTGMPRRKYEDDPDAFRNAERVEFWVKFVVGAVFGGFMGGGLILDGYLNFRWMWGGSEPRPWAAVAMIAGNVVAFGLGYAYTKDDEKFWDIVTPRRWWWRWPWGW